MSHPRLTKFACLGLLLCLSCAKGGIGGNTANKVSVTPTVAPVKSDATCLPGSVCGQAYDEITPTASCDPHMHGVSSIVGQWQHKRRYHSDKHEEATIYSIDGKSLTVKNACNWYGEGPATSATATVAASLDEDQKILIVHNAGHDSSEVNGRKHVKTLKCAVDIPKQEIKYGFVGSCLYFEVGENHRKFLLSRATAADLAI